jgi:FKBP-type peptidyl-prolyl cis-trans isomerase
MVLLFNHQILAAVTALSVLASTASSFQCPSPDVSNRRDAIKDIFSKGAIGFGVIVGSNLYNAEAANALVEGNAPPSKVKKSLGEEYRQGTAALGDSVEAEVLPREAYNKLDSGVIYADISKGDGEEVKEGKKVNTQWVLRRSNGYFVDSSAVSDSVPFIFTVGDPNGAIKGLDEGIRGMRAGGTRRILIPPRLAYVQGVDEGKPGPIPAGFGPRQQMRRVMEVRRDVPGEYIFLEVKVSKVR